MDEDCIFCKIIQGKLPSKLVHETQTCYAFEDINPQAPIHVLIAPKKHIESIANTEDFEIFKHLFSAVKDVAKKLGVLESGFRTVINTGSQACQTVPHLHVHIIGGTQLGGSMVG